MVTGTRWDPLGRGTLLFIGAVDVIALVVLTLSALM